MATTVKVSGVKCSCGCGQKSAATMRMRKLSCNGCGCPLRMTRTWMERNGSPSCGCGGAFEPECLEDRCRIPGAEGEAAWAELAGRETYSAMQSDRAKRGHARRQARKEAAAKVVDGTLTFARNHRGHLAPVDAMPF